MKDLGYGRNYRYAHDEEDAYAAGEKYFPDDMPARKYYHPVPRGLELKIREKLQRNAERDRGVWQEPQHDAAAGEEAGERRKEND